MSKPKWMGEKATRHRSKKQEDSVANRVKGKATIGSGSFFRQNDVEGQYSSIECKVTSKKGYRLTVEEFRKLQKRADFKKVPVFTIEFENENLELAVLTLPDLLMLIDEAKREK